MLVFFLCSCACIVLLCFTDGGEAALTCSLLRDDGLLIFVMGHLGLCYSCRCLLQSEGHEGSSLLGQRHLKSPHCLFSAIHIPRADSSTE